MKICVVSPRYPYGSNAEFIFVRQLVDEWAESGLECTVVTPFSWSSFIRNKIKYAPRCQVDVLPSGRKVRVFRPRYISLPPSIRLFGVSVTAWLESLAVSRILKRQNPDIVYCHFLSSGVSAWKYATSHDKRLTMALGESEYPVPNCPARDFTIEKFRNDLHRVVCVSGENRRLAIESGYICEANSKVFPNGTNLSVFHPMDCGLCRDSLGIDRNVFLIVCVGYFIQRKGQNRIIEALKLLSDSNIKVEFIGSGPENPEYEGIVIKRAVPHDELPTYLCAADVFVLPTLNEGCCNAIVEAMACRLPIISSDRAFNRDILDDSNSILVDPLDIEQIAKAIARLRDDASLRESIAGAAYERARELSIDNRAKNIFSYISQ